MLFIYLEVHALEGLEEALRPACLLEAEQEPLLGATLYIYIYIYMYREKEI